jgi:G:T/U-mismatch repair DNA glycosylase
VFIHLHPYPPFLPESTSKLIVGTLPPPRFSTGELLKEDVNFCYGSKYGLLWPILDEIFKLDLLYENSTTAVEQRKIFLKRHKIGICDIVESCKRVKIDASDLGMELLCTRNLIRVLQDHSTIEILLLMGGMSVNGPGYLLKKQLQSHQIPFKMESEDSIKTLEFNIEQRRVKAYALISPSSAANRAIGNFSTYQQRKSQNPDYSVLDFRMEQYRKVFLT